MTSLDSEVRPSYSNALETALEKPRSRFSLSSLLRKGVLSPLWFPAFGRSSRIGYASAILFPFLVTLLSWVISLFFPNFNARGLFLFGSALLVAYFWGTGPGLLGAVVQALLSNAEHAFPQVTWPVAPQYILQMISFLVIGTALCLLISRLEYSRQLAYQARQHTRNALEALLHFAEELVEAGTIEGSERVNTEAAEGGDLVAQRLSVLIGQMLDYQLASLVLFHDLPQGPRSAAIYGFSPEWEQSVRGPLNGLPGTEQERLLLAGKAVAFDVNEAFSGERRRLLLAPMILAGKLMGVLALGSAEPDHVYTREEISLARALAELAILTLERNRLFQENLKKQATVMALSESNRLMDEFIGIAGHELRTPLTTIKGSTQLSLRQIQKTLQQRETLPEDVNQAFIMLKRHLDRTERQIAHQSRLINDLLDVTRIHANRLELYPSLCNLVSLVRESVENQSSLAPGRQIELILSAPQEVFLQADADRVRQVVENYLSNALKYSDADRPVRVFLDLEGSVARVRVQDEGPGLDAEQQRQIWERFYRVPGIEVKNRSGSGLGLGLHICSMIIQLQGGQIGVESALQQGSTFWFTLPLAGPSQRTASGQQA